MAELEAAEIRRLYPRSAVLAKAEATEEKVKARSHDVLLHFATHAELSKEDPLSSAVCYRKAGRTTGGWR